MSEVLAIGDLLVEVVKRDIKNVHLTVHPPQGRVRIAAPERMQLDTIGCRSHFATEFRIVT
jgi:hypothetical protein